MTSTMQSLLGMNQPTLVDELSGLVYEIAKIDFAWYYGEFIPSLTVSFSEEQRRGLALEGRSGDVDEYAFRQQLDAFMAQVKYLLG